MVGFGCGLSTLTPALSLREREKTVPSPGGEGTSKITAVAPDG